MISQVKIGGIWYKVRPRKMADCGRFEADRKTIWIKANMDEDVKELTLIHEILHAINLNIDEERVEFIAQALYQVYKDNWGVNKPTRHL